MLFSRNLLWSIPIMDLISKSFASEATIFDEFPSASSIIVASKANKGSKGSKSNDGPGGYFLDSKQSSSYYFPQDEPSDNVCAGAAIALSNKLCADLSVSQPQAGADVTLGYVGKMDVDVTVSTDPFLKKGMCPVNVHWHLGAEHRSAGQFDENGVGPEYLSNVRLGFRCNYYDKNNEKFSKAYKWKYCVGMEVGETYEVHWPHSAAGACGTVDQYQTPFLDGVFCNLSEEDFSKMDAQAIANAVGVQAQVFTIINDESYFYPDLIKGMITYAKRDMGTDVTFYSGSTTGTRVNNEICSQYAPITWQVDRKCHLISASSFDKLCLDMKLQRDDMSDDLRADGSRELVSDNLAADNQQTIGDRMRTLRA